MAAVSGGLEFGTQYLSNVLVRNDFSLGNIDYFDVSVAATFKTNGVTMLSQSFLTVNKDGFDIEGLESATINFLARKTGSKLTGKFNSTIGNSLSNFSPAIGGYLQGVGLTGVKTSVKSVVKYSRDKNNEVEKK